MANVSQIKLPNNTTYDIDAKTVNGKTVESNVPSGAVFTDTNDKVKQSPSTIDANYELLFSGSADNREHIETAKKTSSLYFNPNKSALTTGTRASGTVGSYSFTAGQDNVASHSQSIAVGYGNTARADQAFACGNGNTAAGNYSHVEGKGCSTTDNAWYQHAEGQSCTAGGDAGHAEGCATVTDANYSHAEGLGTYAGSQAQHVFGKYNTKDTSSTYVEIVGNGSADDARSYARRLSWTGDEELAGSLTATDIIKTAKWDGTNTSLQTVITAIRNSLPTSTTSNGWYITKFPNIKFAICRYVNTTKHTGGTKSYSTASSPITFKNATVSVSAMVAGRTDTNVQYTNVSTNGVEAYVSCGVTGATNTRVTFTVFTDYD